MFPIEEFAQKFVEDHPSVKRCYVAIIRGMSGHYNLEVEISDGEIGATFDTGTPNLEHAREFADDLEMYLAHFGQVRVFSERCDWEIWLYDQFRLTEFENAA